MADLLPSAPDTSAVEEAAPRVIGVDSDDADDLIAALSSETARELLAALHEDPANPAKLADRVDTTIQNAQYHLGKLQEADLIEVVDTVYSEKGREMNVYAPSDRPLVVVAGADDDETADLRAALSRLLGALSGLAVSSLLVEELFGRGVLDVFGGDGARDGAAPDDGAGAADGYAEATGTPVDQSAKDTVGSPSPKPTETPTDGPSIAEVDTPTPDPTSTATSEPATATPTPTDLETATSAATDVTPQALDGAAALPPGLLFFAGGATVLLVAFAFWYVRGR